VKSNPKWDVVGVGLNAVDFLCVVPHMPAFDTKLRMSRFLFAGGGQVATALVALARWGLKCAYVGKVGDDDLGRFTIGELQRESVDTRWVSVARGAASQCAAILIDESSGERTIVWHRPKASELAPEELPPELVTSCRALLVDGHEAEAALAAAKAASEAGAVVVFDAEEVSPLTGGLMSFTDHCIGTPEFTRAFSAKEDLLEGLRAIRAAGPEVAGVTLGRGGYAALDEAGLAAMGGFKVPVVDTTGCGDVFHAAYLFSLLEGRPLAERLEFANAAAALKCRELGGREGIPTLEELEAFLADPPPRHPLPEPFSGQRADPYLERPIR
jgi:sugar/nucleoside kinase (ribokinase family)